MQRNEAGNSDAEPEIRELPSCLGYGGVMFHADGTQRSMDDHEVLPTVIPLWTTLPEHDADTVDLCIRLSRHDHPAVRAAAIGAFAAIASRGGVLAVREPVIDRVATGLRDPDESVRSTASHVADVLEATLGWHVPRG